MQESLLGSPQRVGEAQRLMAQTFGYQWLATGTKIPVRLVDFVEPVV